jgi:hypothetical protein
MGKLNSFPYKKNAQFKDLIQMEEGQKKHKSINQKLMIIYFLILISIQVLAIYYFVNNPNILTGIVVGISLGIFLPIILGLILIKVFKK